MKIKFKKGLSKFVVYFLSILLSYLLVVNIAHIIYLNKYIEIDFNAKFMLDIKKDLTELETSINEVKNLNATNYSNEDLEIIKTYLDELLANIKGNKLLSYSGTKRIYLKDLYEIDDSQLYPLQQTLKTVDILVKYDESLKGYTQSLKTEFVSNAFGNAKELREPLKGYGYQVLEFDPIHMEIDDSRLLFRVYRLQHNITKANYIVDLVLKVGANNE